MRQQEDFQTQNLAEELPWTEESLFALGGHIDSLRVESTISLVMKSAMKRGCADPGGGAARGQSGQKWRAERGADGRG